MQYSKNLWLNSCQDNNFLSEADSIFNILTNLTNLMNLAILTLFI